MKIMGIQGNTYPHRHELNARGCKWAPNYDVGAYWMAWDHPDRQAVAEWADALGLTVYDDDVDDEELAPESYAEKRARKQGRAAARAAKHVEIATRLDARANGRHAALNRDWAYISQPASPGSALGRSKARDIAAMDRAHAEFKEAQDRRGRAAGLAHMATADVDQSAAFMHRRIQEAEAEIRKADRGIEKMRERGEEPNQHYLAWRAAEVEKRDHWQALLSEKTAGQETIDPAAIQIGDRVHIRRGWATVVGKGKVNVKVVFLSSHLEVSYPWAEVVEHKRRSAVEPIPLPALGDLVKVAGSPGVNFTIDSVNPNTGMCSGHWIWQHHRGFEEKVSRRFHAAQIDQAATRELAERVKA